ncbi:MAG: SAM hydrolase/SAM-dependent halogenase family protein, partial [Thermodesulfobacteriota bacterium]
FKLISYYTYFPRGTVHVVVVDPGVGGQRRPIAAEAGGYFFVGPDNGVFSPVIDSVDNPRVVEITNAGYTLGNVSGTFHGRDIFAPAAAHLSSGVDICKLGDLAAEPVSLDIPEPSVNGNEISGVVLYVDSFGNLVTNIPGGSIKRGSRVYVDGYELDRISGWYGEAGKGELLAIIGSAGLLEISVNQGSAKELLGKKRVSVRVVTD